MLVLYHPDLRYGFLTSIVNDKKIIRTLNFTSLLYFALPCLTSRCLTVLIKYQLRMASTTRYMTFSQRSQISLMWMYLFTKPLVTGSCEDQMTTTHL